MRVTNCIYVLLSEGRRADDPPNFQVKAMHIPDGFVSGPINLATFVVSATAVGIAVSRAKKHMDEKEAPLLGVTAAFVFAAQMLNFPVAGGTSGHFLGALLAGVLLGPFNACLVLTLVLIIQALVFADGGVTALGSNIFLMGVVGGIVATYFFYGLKRLFPKTKRGFIAAVAVASWVSVASASVACALLLALSGTSPLKAVLPAMLGVHALIGIGEALITTSVVSTVLAVRSDLVGAWDGGHAA
jgi:cobalt/nickel transport system permease protein